MLVLFWVAFGCSKVPDDGILVEGAEGMWNVGDMNGDGTDDVAFARVWEHSELDGLWGQLYVDVVFDDIQTRRSWVLEDELENLDHETFSTAQKVSMEWSIAPVGDLDGDGLADLAVTTWMGESGGKLSTDSDLLLLFGEEDQHPTAVEVSDTPFFELQSGGDLNGDGLSDLLGIAAVYGNPAAVLLGATGLGDVALGDADFLLLEGYFPSLRPVGDVDGDGIDDLAAFDDCSILAFPGQATWSDSTDMESLPTTSFAFASEGCDDQRRPIGLGDINGDGFGDFALALGGRKGSAETWRFAETEIPVVFGQSDGISGYDLDTAPVIIAPGPVTQLAREGLLGDDLASPNLLLLVEQGTEIGFALVEVGDLTTGSRLEVEADHFIEPEHIPSGGFVGDVDGDQLGDLGIHYPEVGVWLYGGR